MGITNTLATMPGFIGPSIVGAITNKNVSRICHVMFASQCDALKLIA